MRVPDQMYCPHTPNHCRTLSCTILRENLLTRRSARKRIQHHIEIRTYQPPRRLHFRRWIAQWVQREGY